MKKRAEASSETATKQSPKPADRAEGETFRMEVAVGGASKRDWDRAVSVDPPERTKHPRRKKVGLFKIPPSCPKEVGGIALQGGLP